MGRKGIVNDLIFLFVWVFAFGVFALGMYIAWADTNTALQASDAISQEAKDLFGRQAEAYPEWMDDTLLTIMIGVALGVAILSYFVSTQPLLFWPLWIVVMTLAIAGGYIANSYLEFTAQDEKLQVASEVFSLYTYIITHYVEIIVSIGMLMLLIYFAKPSTGEPV